MDDNTQKYIDDMRDLFLTEGWQWIVAECTNLEQQYSQVDGVSTIEQLSYAKGVLFAVRNISRLPDMIRDLEEGEEDA